MLQSSVAELELTDVRAWQLHAQLLPLAGALDSLGTDVTERAAAACLALAEPSLHGAAEHSE
eukprot:574108-Rhodomonas_salina.1